MIRALCILLSCQLAGEIAARGLGLPVPGPVLGLVILFLGLQAATRWNGLDPEEVEGTPLGRTATELLRNLALLFVPAGVGVVEHLGLLGEHGPALLLALVGSTAITLAVTALAFVGVGRLMTRSGR